MEKYDTMPETMELLKKNHKYIWDFNLEWKRTIAMVLNVYQNYGTVVYIHS